MQAEKVTRLMCTFLECVYEQCYMQKEDFLNTKSLKKQSLVMPPQS